MAPNVDLFRYRPALANPPLCSFLDCERITLSQLMDMHEVLDLRAAGIERAAETARQTSQGRHRR